MKYSETSGKTIQEAFDEFHVEHPTVYEYFKKYTKVMYLSQRKRGIKHEDIKTSSKMILNRIRWEISVAGLDLKNKPDGPVEEKVEQGIYTEFKINDAFTSRYTRLFQEDFPKFAHIFNTRNLRS